jgi:thiamine-phosphate pyrophosphorylase
MARCYSEAMRKCQPLPAIWLISDARNDAVLETALLRLPRGSGFIYRHYHLGEAERRARFAQLCRIARARGHLVALAGSAAQARRWGADKAYGPGGQLVPVHSLSELRNAARADAVLLSPAFPTRSHPGGKVLGPLRWRLIAARAQVPVIALGGMNPYRAKRLKTAHWAGIDAFCGEVNPRILKDS